MGHSRMEHGPSFLDLPTPLLKTYQYAHLSQPLPDLLPCQLPGTPADLQPLPPLTIL